MTDFIASRRRRVRIQVTVQILLMLWIVWVINVWSFHDTVRSDWSEDGLLTVTAADQELLDALPRSVDVLVPLDLQPDAGGRIRARVLFQAIRWLDELSRSAADAISPPVQVDVNRQADRWELIRASRQLEADAVNQVHLFCGDHHLTLDVEDLAIIREPSPLEPEQMARIEIDRVREAVEAGLRQVVSDRFTEIRISQGNGEPPLESMREVSLVRLVEDLRQRGSRISAVDLSGPGEIDDSADLLVVIGGGTGGHDPVGESIRRQVDRFLEGGGGVVILLPATGTTGLESTMEDAGIRVLPGLAAQVAAMPGKTSRSSFMVLGERLDPTHPVTRSLARSRFSARFNPGRVLQVQGQAVGLMATGPSAWLERDPVTPRRDRDELPAPQLLAAASEVGDGRLVVLGNWNSTLPAYWGGDARRLILASCDWASGRDLLPAGAGREPISNRVELDAPVRRSFFWTSMVVVPACALLGGWFLARVRRRDR